MKKILALILSLILVLSLASCGCSKKDKDKNDDKIKTEQGKNSDVSKENKEKVKEIVTNETSNTKDEAEEIFEAHKDKEATSVNMYNLFKTLNIVDIKDTTMKVDVLGSDLIYRIINNEKKFDVSPIAYAKVSAAIFAIHPEIERITYEMKYQGENYNYYYFDSITDVAKVLNNNYYNAQTLAKARESENNLKNYLAEIDKIKVPEASIEDALKKCTDYGPKADFPFKQYDSHFVKHSFILSPEADLPPGIDNFYFLNDEDLFGGHKGDPIELIEINAKQSNIETPVKMHFIFCGNELIYFGNVEGYDDLSIKTLRFGLTDEIIEEYRHRMENNK